MSFILHGIGASEGIAIGRAHLVTPTALKIVHYLLPKHQVDLEILRLNNAFATVRKELEALKASIAQGPVFDEFSAFLDLHHMILNDPMLSEAANNCIMQTRCNAEWAINQQMDSLLVQFEEIDDAYLRERKADVTQVVERVLKALLGHPSAVPPPVKQSGDRILVTHDLSPADVMMYKQHRFAAFLTDAGSSTSHAAIVARSLNIPSIVALHHARHLILENDYLIVDGSQNIVIINPGKYVLSEYRLRKSQVELEKRKLKRIKSIVTMTLDKTPIDLYANIELPEDVAQAKESGAIGIGLFRSEFLFLKRNILPDEDEQFEAYREVAVSMHGLPVTIRTFDLGADKSLTDDQRMSANPALGLRAIRYCLTEPQFFRTQLRAILRASHFGNVRILIPMLSTVSEVKQTLQLLENAKQDLRDEKIAFNEQILIGGMIETPAAALCVQLFIRKLDFLSIGTNDLIQYTLAIDRTDDMVANLYDPLHPAVMWLVAHTIKAANRAKLSVAVCGEMAGDIQFTRILLGMGLRQFSVYPAQLLAVKHQILQSHLPSITPLVHKITKSESPEKIYGLLMKLND